MKSKHDKIVASLLKYPNRVNSSIAKNHSGVSSSDVQEVRDWLAKQSGHAPPQAAAQGGFCLRGAKVLSRRPAESAAKFIKRLPSGRGFDPRELAKEWGMSEETIRRHARDLGCLKFVEVSDDEWLPLIMNPETAKQYSL